MLVGAELEGKQKEDSLYKKKGHMRIQHATSLYAKHFCTVHISQIKTCENTAGLQSAS